MLFRRLLSTKTTSGVQNLFQLFPKTFPQGTVKFRVDPKSLRKEYRLLQQQLHPDSNVDHTSTESYDDSQSSLLNKGYTTLKSSLSRSQHILELNGIDLKQDEVSKQYSMKDQELLYELLDIHEELENAETEEEMEKYKERNDERLLESEEKLESLFEKGDFEEAALETVKLKYWWNIANAIKNWEPGQPVHMTH